MDLEFHFERGGVLRAQTHPDAPQTAACLAGALPWEGPVLQARWAGREIFLPVDLPEKPPRERQSIRAGVGDVIYFREWPEAYDFTGFEAIGLFYGPEIVREWRGDAPVNVFARIDPADTDLLHEIGERVWRQGSERVTVRAAGSTGAT